MQQKIAWFAAIAALVGAAFVGGCGSAEPDDVPIEVGNVSQRIWNGSSQGNTPEENTSVLVRIRTPLVPPPGFHVSQCTGTLLTPQLVLTSAHCMNGVVDAPPAGGCPPGSIPPSPGVATGTCPPTVSAPHFIQDVEPLGAPDGFIDGFTVFVGNTDTSVPPDGIPEVGSPDLLPDERRVIEVRRMTTNPIGASEADQAADLALLVLEAPESAAAHQSTTVKNVLDNGYPSYLAATRPASGFSAEIVGWGRTKPVCSVSGVDCWPADCIGAGVGCSCNLAAGETCRVSTAEIRQQNGYASFPYTPTGAGNALLGVLFALPYTGVDSGDSGGGLFQRDLRGNLISVVGVAAAGTAANYGDGTLHPYRAVCEATGATCVPANCPGASCTCAVGDTCNEANPNPIAVFLDVATPGTPVKTWLATNMAHPTLPGRLIGERDYRGPHRPAVDADGDRLAERLWGCPMIFHTGAASGYGPSHYDSLPGLAAYGRWVSINDRAQVFDSAGNRGTIAAAEPNWWGTFVRNDAKVGTVITQGKAWFGHRYTVDRILSRVAPTIFTQNGADLSPITHFTANVPPIILNVAYPTTPTTNVDLEPGQQFPLPGGGVVTPGQYIPRVSLKAGAVLRLGAGQYFIDDLTMEPGSRIEIDHTLGHTEIYVRSSIQPKGEITSLAGDPWATLVGYFGSGTAHVTGSMNATFVAPNASIALSSKDHYGAYYAGLMLELHQGGSIHHRRLTCSP